MSESRRLREYGLGESTQFVEGVPEAILIPDSPPCPNCGCCQLMLVKVKIRHHPMLRGREGKGVGTYMGCPACPYASPMLMVAMGEGPGERKEGQ